MCKVYIGLILVMVSVLFCDYGKEEREDVSGYYKSFKGTGNCCCIQSRFFIPISKASRLCDYLDDEGNPVYDFTCFVESKVPYSIVDAPQQGDEISETDPLDTDAGEYRDKPAVQNPGNTGALTAYEAVWGGSYMDEAGRWVVLLTENTVENQEKVFQLNPTLTAENTVF